MIRLFIKFVLISALVFIACRWTFYRLLEGQVFSDRQRIVAGLTDVYLGGLRIVAQELATEDKRLRERRWDTLQVELDSPLEVRPLSELTSKERMQLSKPKGFIYTYRNEFIDYLGVQLDTEHYLRLGPIADKTSEGIEEKVLEWLRVLERKIASSNDINALLKRISSESRVPVRLIVQGELPSDTQQRIASGKRTAFYSKGDDYYVAMPLQGRDELLSLGPLTKVKAVAERTMSRAMWIWFSIVMGAAAWLVYNVSSKFRRIEIAARKIAEGDFDTRVDESNAGESKVLAYAFNVMASNTEESIRSKKELLQAISHELRTPLSRLRFAVELLEGSADPEVKQSRMMVVRQSIDNLDDIVGEVLDYVQNEDQLPVKTREWIEIQPGLLPMIKVFELEHPHLKFEWVFAGTSVCTDVYADRIPFHRVVRNLLSNAVRFAKSTVRIHVYRSGGEKPTVCVEVEDDGPGIPKAKRNEVLSPFVRIEPDARREVRSAASTTGLGLGLAIVDRSLKQHSGTVSIHRGELGGCLVRTSWPIP